MLKLATRPVDRLALHRLVEDGVDPLLARLLVARGVRHADEGGLELASLLAPTMRGLDRAAAIVSDAIDEGAPIVVVGDYDCDGATGVATGVLGLRMLGARVDYLVPSRFDNGYGLSPEVAELAARHPRLGRPALLVTVDNGIASVDGVARANALGMRVVVTDHHLPGAALPAAAALVDPNLPDCPFASKSIAGVGVMFYLLMAVRAHRRRLGRFADGGAPNGPPIADLLDLVALGTVADVVPLDRNNRILVAAGLRRIRAGRGRPGIVALLRVAGREPRSIAARDLGFTVGPRINAVGRLADMSLGVECLLADDLSSAERIALQLDETNRSRREIESAMKAQADALTIDVEPGRRALVLHDDAWHHGVIGLVASRMKEQWHRPCFALAPDGGPGSGHAGRPDAGTLLRGSGRSIAGVHLRDVLDLVDKRCPGMLLKFGGHAMAAGLTMPAGRLAEFVDAFEDAVARLADPECFVREVLTDGPLEPDAFVTSTIDRIDTQVWGQGFAEPLFSGRFRVLSQRVIKDRHLKLDLAFDDVGPGPARRLSAIAFGRTAPVGATTRIAYRLQRDEWRGGTAVTLLVDRFLDEAGSAIATGAQDAGTPLVGASATRPVGAD
ncbi:MAG: single-stranded-DNA-specific exonuclease RecJ [Lautropia sp.]